MAEEKNKATKDHNTNQEAIQKVKEQLEEQMSTLREEHDDKVQDLENRLQVALGMLITLFFKSWRIIFYIIFVFLLVSLSLTKNFYTNN